MSFSDSVAQGDSENTKISLALENNFLRIRTSVSESNMVFMKSLCSLLPASEKFRDEEMIKPECFQNRKTVVKLSENGLDAEIFRVRLIASSKLHVLSEISDLVRDFASQVKRNF